MYGPESEKVQAPLVKTGPVRVPGTKGALQMAYWSMKVPQPAKLTVVLPPEPATLMVMVLESLIDVTWLPVHRPIARSVYG
jgi:hypothetical protein